MWGHSYKYNSSDICITAKQKENLLKTLTSSVIFSLNTLSNVTGKHIKEHFENAQIDSIIYTQ